MWGDDGVAHRDEERGQRLAVPWAGATAKKIGGSYDATMIGVPMIEACAGDSSVPVVAD